MMVAKISETLAQILAGQEYFDNHFYNPIQDLHDNWIISLIEAHYLGNEDYQIITYEPKLKT